MIPPTLITNRVGFFSGRGSGTGVRDGLPLEAIAFSFRERRERTGAAGSRQFNHENQGERTGPNGPVKEWHFRPENPVQEEKCFEFPRSPRF
jgi:hypothetical protein